jgi:hypothetical protein
MYSFSSRDILRGCVHLPNPCFWGGSMTPNTFHRYNSKWPAVILVIIFLYSVNPHKESYNFYVVKGFNERNVILGAFQIIKRAYTRT